MNIQNLITVRELANRTKLSESAWRVHLLHRGDNGLDRAVVRLGKRIFLDLEEVSKWLEERREAPTSRAPACSP
jgi:hypothetical protein